jgi:hypothetical protein
MKHFKGVPVINFGNLWLKVTIIFMYCAEYKVTDFQDRCICYDEFVSAKEHSTLRLQPKKKAF